MFLLSSPHRATRSRVLSALILTVTLGVLFQVGPAQAAPSGPTIRYISPTGAGAGDGRDWANAATFDRLPAMVTAVGAGGRVLLRADQGAYHSSGPVTLRSGGALGSPVIIRGATPSGGPAVATVRGTRTSPYSSTGDPGAEVFKLLEGADHLSFRHLSFVDVGNGAIRVGADIADLDIRNIEATNVRRLLEDNASSGAATATISGLTMRDVTVRGFSRGAVRLQYDSHDILLEDVTGDSERQDGDNFSIGVHLSGTVHDVVLRRVSMSNSTDTVDSYWNGDGFAAEGDTYRIRLEDTRATGSTDAGYDMKSDDLTMIRTTAIDNKRNYRLWGQGVTLSEASAQAPILRGGSGSQAQYWIGPRAQVRIADSTASDASVDTVVYELEPGVGHLAVEGGTITLSAHARLSKVGAGSELAWGVATVRHV